MSGGPTEGALQPAFSSFRQPTEPREEVRTTAQDTNLTEGVSFDTAPLAPTRKTWAPLRLAAPRGNYSTNAPLGGEEETPASLGPSLGPNAWVEQPTSWGSIGFLRDYHLRV